MDRAIVELLPLGHCVLEKLLERQWAGVLRSYAEEYVRHIGELIEHMKDVVVMQLAERRVLYAVELICQVQLGDGGVNGIHRERVAGRERWRLGDAGVVDVVGGTPGIVDPVRA